jgi:hypothetical protein
VAQNAIQHVHVTGLAGRRQRQKLNGCIAGLGGEPIGYAWPERIDHFLFHGERSTWNCSTQRQYDSRQFNAKSYLQTSRRLCDKRPGFRQVSPEQALKRQLSYPYKSQLFKEIESSW